MTPERQTARDFLAHAAKRNHGLEAHTDENGKTVIDKACGALIFRDDKVVGMNEGFCDCGARRHNVLVEMALNTLVVKEKK